jgi:uncharacterized membrane protein YqjE
VSDRIVSDREHAVEPLQPDKSLGELFGELTSDMSRLFRQEVELAKTEARQEAARAGKGAGMLAGAGLSAWLALLLISFAVAWWLDKAMDRGLAFVLVALVWAIAAAVLASTGKKRLASARPLPKTTQTLKEDAQWLKAQKS